VSDQRWSWVIRGAVIWYCLLAILLIDAQPGFNYDEAIDVRGAVHLRHSHGEFPLPHQPNAWYCLKGHCLPLITEESGIQYIVTALVLLLAASVDAISRRRAAAIRARLGGGPHAPAAAQ